MVKSRMPSWWWFYPFRWWGNPSALLGVCVSWWDHSMHDAMLPLLMLLLPEVSYKCKQDPSCGTKDKDPILLTSNFATCFCCTTKRRHTVNPSGCERQDQTKIIDQQVSKKIHFVGFQNRVHPCGFSYQHFQVLLKKMQGCQNLVDGQSISDFRECFFLFQPRMEKRYQLDGSKSHPFF